MQQACLVASRNRDTLVIKTKFRSLHSFIAGSLLLASSSVSAQTLPDPLTGSVVLDVSGGPVTYGGNSSVNAATLSFTSDGSGTRAAILPGSLTGTGSLAFDDPGTLSLTGASSYSGGTIVRNGTFSVGSTGTLGVNDTTTRRLTVTGDGSLVVDGGTATFRGSGNTDNNAILIGDTVVASGGNLTVQNNGSLTLSQGRFIIGGGSSASASNTAATSVFSQTSGSTTIANGFTNVGNITPGSLNISGGTFTAGTLNMGVRANSTLTVSGANTVVTLGNLSFGGGGASNPVAGTNAVVNLNGGTLAASSVAVGSDTNRTHTFNFDGGTLQARGNSATFFSPTLALTATVKAGGGTIDNNGFDIGIARDLLEDPVSTGGGMTFTGGGTTTLTGTPTYTGNTTITEGTLHLKGATGLPADPKIMPLGDSITVGGSTSGYRFPLYQHLLPLAPGFQFIGDTTTSPGSLPAGSQSHSGRSSYSTDDIRNNLDGLDFTTFNTYGQDSRDPRGGHWLTGLASPITYTVPNRGTFTYGPRDPLHPDIILLLVGTNDLYRAGSTNGDHRANYTALLNEIYRLRPAVHVFAAKITPHKTNDAPAVAFNTIVGEVVADFQAAGKPITLVDLHTGYTGSFTDNLHPDAAGYAWIAGKWRDALTATLSTELPLSLRSSAAVEVAAGATLSGNALVNHLAVDGILAPGAAQTGTITATSATLPGSYQCQIDGGSCDRLIVEGDLDLTGGTLALSVNAPAARAHVIATYGGALTGTFATVTGMPEGFEFHHDMPRKRLIVGRPYDIWRASHNLPDATGAAIPDSDSDGTNDLLEFIGGSDPTDPASRPPSETRVQDGPAGDLLFLVNFILPAGAVFAPAGDGSLMAAALGVMLQVQGSRDLVHWNEPVAPASPSSALPAPPAGYEYQAFSLPADGVSSMGFMRLTAMLPVP
jgi:fibronectin-binding autotransporter adhesin